MKLFFNFASLIYILFAWCITPTQKQPGSMYEQNPFLIARNGNIVLSSDRNSQAEAAQYMQLSQTSTPTPSNTSTSNEPGTKSLTRTPKPTPTPLKIPPPTDPKNLSLMIFLLLVIVIIVVIGLLTGRRNTHKHNDHRNN